MLNRKEMVVAPTTTPSTNHSLPKQKEADMPTLTEIVAYLNKTQLNVTDRIEAQKYVLKLAEMAGHKEKKPYIYHVQLVNHTTESDMEAEGWKRCFDTLQVGVVPMRAGTVRKNWYDTSKDGYPAGKGGSVEYVYRTSQPPMEGRELQGFGETPLEVMDADYASIDAATNDWLASVESATDNIGRIVALAGGISANKEWLI